MKPKISRTALSKSLLPEDIMQLILTRLPVKSLTRFKSVCKAWHRLLSSPKFIKSHHDHLSADPKNQCVIIYGLLLDHHSITFRFNLHLPKRKPSVVDHPFFLTDLLGAGNPYPHSDIIGCSNGLFCVTRIAHGVVIWNPAMNLFKPVEFEAGGYGMPLWVSLGFGYDSVGEDYKVVRLLGLKDMKGVVRVEVYSVYEGSWEVVLLEFEFRSEPGNRCDAIVNGNPYWIARVDDGDEVLVGFDVTEMEFEVVRLTEFNSGEEAESEIGVLDWNGSLGALMFSKDGEGLVDSLRVWVFDGEDRVWRKVRTFELNKMRVDSFLHSSRSEKFLCGCVDGELFGYDPCTGRVKKVPLHGVHPRSLEVYGYSESLAYVKGMVDVDEDHLPSCFQ